MKRSGMISEIVRVVYNGAVEKIAQGGIDRYELAEIVLKACEEAGMSPPVIGKLSKLDEEKLRGLFYWEDEDENNK